MSRRLNILLSAYFCSPYRGGESAVGWQTAVGLARHHDVTVICGDHASDSPTLTEINRYIEQNGQPAGLTIRHVQAEGLGQSLNRLHSWPGLWFLYYEGYRRWQLQALKEAELMHALRPFDLAHQLTIITCREPGYLWRLGVPWFWGPISGAVLMPWAFLPSLGFHGCYRHLTRNLLNVLHTRFSHRCHQVIGHAAKIWAVTQEDQVLVEQRWGGQAETMIETGAVLREGMQPKKLENGQPIKLVWCGIIEARKALNLLLEALNQSDIPCGWELHIIGTGPDEGRERRRAVHLGLSSKVKWHGKVSHEQAQLLMSSCHLLVHTALKEGTPHVVLEALSLGLPVLCHDACGMGVAVNESCGLKVPLLSPSESIRGFQEAIQRLAADPLEYARLSRGALNRARELTWELNISRISEAYLAELER